MSETSNQPFSRADAERILQDAEDVVACWKEGGDDPETNNRWPLSHDAPEVAALARWALELADENEQLLSRAKRAPSGQG